VGKKLQIRNKSAKQALVIDDHPILRNGVKDILQASFPFLTIKASPGSTDLLQTISRRRWAFVVLDINLPGQNGIDIIKQIRLRCPSLSIIVFSHYPEKQYATRSLRAGASAYLSKERQPRELVRAVKSVINASPTREPDEPPPLKPTLSNREVQVLSLIVKGMSRKEISQTLCIDGKTVSTYRLRLFTKLNVRNNIELLRFAMEERLL